MKRKKSKPVAASQMRSSFPLRAICGTWVSLCGSPDIRVCHDGSRYRLQLMYKDGTIVTAPLLQRWGITFFDFYGMIRIVYDDERDVLSLTVEGDYKRVYE